MFPGVEGITLDFPIEGKRGALAQFNRFPASLVALAGKLGLGLDLSIYSPEQRESDV